MYFTITGAKNCVCYTEDVVVYRFVISRFHCIMVCLATFRLLTAPLHQGA